MEVKDEITLRNRLIATIIVSLIGFLVIMINFLRVEGERKSNYQIFSTSVLEGMEQVKANGVQSFELEKQKFELLFSDDVMFDLYNNPADATALAKLEGIALNRMATTGSVSDIVVYSLSYQHGDDKNLITPTCIARFEKEQSSAQPTSEPCSKENLIQLDKSYVFAEKANKLVTLPTIATGSGYTAKTYTKVYHNITNQSFDTNWNSSIPVMTKLVVIFRRSEDDFVSSVKATSDTESNYIITNEDLEVVATNNESYTINGDSLTNKHNISFDNPNWNFYGEKDGSNSNIEVTKDNFMSAELSSGGKRIYVVSPNITLAKRGDYNDFLFRIYDESKYDFFRLDFVSILFTIDIIFTTLMMIGVAIVAWHLTKLIDKVRLKARKNKDVEKFIDHMVEFSENVSYADDKGTAEHIGRITYFTKQLVGELPNLDEHFKKKIIKNSKMHDIGKLTVDKDIINKKGKLTDAEFDKIKGHTANGYDFAKSLNMDEVALNIIKHHHENYDGSGYPDKLKGDAIPIEARILRVVDTYDALREERSYKKAWPEAQVRDYMIEHKGTLFDPELVDKFLSKLETLTDEEKNQKFVKDIKSAKDIRPNAAKV